MSDARSGDHGRRTISFDPRGQRILVPSITGFLLLAYAVPWALGAVDSPGFGWAVLFSLVLFVLATWSVRRLCRAAIDDHYLYLRNGSAEQAVPFDAIAAVNDVGNRRSTTRNIVVRFHSRTRLGREIVFLARCQAEPGLLRRREHPIVGELRRRAGLERRAGSARPMRRRAGAQANGEQA